MSDEPQFISASAAARKLGVPVSLVLRAVEAGKIPASRSGEFKNSAFLVPVAAVEALRREAPDILPHR